MWYAFRFGFSSFLIIALAALSGCPRLLPGQTRTFDGIEFQYCPPGTFYMGSPLSEEGRQPDEPLHEVTLSRGYWLGKYEVTQTQWVEVMGSNPSYATSVGDDLPVNMVSWYDAQDFIIALNEATTGATYRLPTEAEWECACRAGRTARYYWEYDRDLARIDRYCWRHPSAGQVLHPVGEKRPNEWGLYDMSGNILEWCQDWYGDYPTVAVTDPQGPETGNRKIVRGGCYLDEAIFCRSAARYVCPPGFEDLMFPPLIFGFRLVREVDPCHVRDPRIQLFDLPVLNYLTCR
jgi:formylglycine-generating enzyme required for sulfatase activity